MDLDHVAVELRPRSGWEAIDVGFRLARRSYGRLVGVALVLLLPLAAVSTLVLWRWPFLVWVVAWWTKPIWERALLHVVSRGFFGEEVSVRDAVASLRASWRRDALAWLTIRRFSPTRCIDLPVTVLEGTTGEARRQRIRLLHIGPLATSAFWLTMVGAHVEAFLPLATLTLVDLLVPPLVDWSALAWYFDPETVSHVPGLVGSGLGVVAAALVAPFYVAGGFSLYVHRRTVLEGWDLQIAFERLARRLEGLGRAAAALLLVLLPVLVAPAVHADALHGTSADARIEEARSSARTEIERVLAGPEFHHEQTWKIPRFLRDWRLDTHESEWPTLPSWLRSTIEILARSVEVIVVALILAALLVVVWQLRLLEAPARGLAVGVRRRPARVMGLDLSPESLPDDVGATARAEWRAGRARTALALLYRASLARLVDHHAVELSESDTEGCCLRAARARMEGEPFSAFSDLTRAWSLLAYAHRAPGDEAFEALITSFERHLAVEDGRGADHG